MSDCPPLVPPPPPAWALVAAAVAGGALGSGVRAALALALPAATCQGSYAVLGSAVTISASGFPRATFTVNCVGTFVLGVLAQLSNKYAWSPYVLATVGTGFCGGLTTFSSLIIEVIRLSVNGKVGLAVAYLIATQVVGLLLGGLGWFIASRV